MQVVEIGKMFYTVNICSKIYYSKNNSSINTSLNWFKVLLQNTRDIFLIWLFLSYSWCFVWRRLYLVWCSFGLVSKIISEVPKELVFWSCLVCQPLIQCFVIMMKYHRYKFGVLLINTLQFLCWANFLIFQL